MSNFRQNENPIYDEFDPDNLDMDDIIKRRWKSKSGKAVGIKNNDLPLFKKVFLDPKQLASQPMSDKVREFLKENEIAIKSLDGQPCPYPFLTWESTQFPPQIKNVIDGLQFRAPTPIQSVVFPLILSGYDVIGVAETGSGKTFGYLLPGLIQLKCQKYPQNFTEGINGPEMLILAPTRELVMQIAQQVSLFMKSNNLTVATAFGGQNRDQQASQIRRNPNILVACPGRLKDFLQEGIVKLQFFELYFLIFIYLFYFLQLKIKLMRIIQNLINYKNLNQISLFLKNHYEADRLLDMGFEDDVRYIVQRTRSDRQTAFFSATWPKAVRNLSLDFCAEDPIYVQVGRSNITINKNIDQEILCLYNNQKLQTLLDILDQLKINDKVLIFAETRISCEQLSVDMTNEGYYAVALHGNKTQGQRDSIMACYKKGDTKLLCATDLASRGLDVSDITVVINYDFPKYFDDYIHRIGRTGRAGRRGRAISFFSIGKDQPQMARELLKFNRIHKLKLDEQLMQELANGIKQERNNNFNGVSKYGGQIMTHQNNSKFTVPNLSKEEQAKFYMQPYQFENVQSRQSNYGRQDQSRSNKGQYHNRQNLQEEAFYQDKYQRNNQQRRQQEGFPNQNKFEGHNNFQGQRRQEYLDTGRDDGRQGYQKNHQPRFENQERWPNNQLENQGRYQDNRRDQYTQNREDKNDIQYRQTPQQQGFPPQNRDQWNSNQRDQPYGARVQQPYQKDQQNNDQRGQPPHQQNQFNYQRDFQKDQQRNPFLNDKDQNNNRNYNQEQRNNQYQQPHDQGRGQQPYDQGRNFNNYRAEGQSENYRNQNPNQRQYYNQDHFNRQGFSQNEYNQQHMKTNPSDNQRDRNFDQNQQNYPRNTNDRFQQDSRQGNQNNWQQGNQNNWQQRTPYDQNNNQRFNDNKRENNTRNLMDVNKPQDDNQQIRKDSSQYT